MTKKPVREGCAPAQGVGEQIAGRHIPKVFLLNGSHDRETSASKSTAGPMTACDVVLAVCDALNRRHGKVHASPDWLDLANCGAAATCALVMQHSLSVSSVITHARVSEVCAMPSPLRPSLGLSNCVCVPSTWLSSQS